MNVSCVYRNVQNGNNVWTLLMGEERNSNSIRIHNNSIGKTLYECDDVWDSDLFKIARILKRHEFSHLKLEDVLKKINRECRHLEIPTYIAHEHRVG